MLAGLAPLRAEHHDGEAFEHLLSALPVLQLPVRESQRVSPAFLSNKRRSGILLTSVLVHLLFVLLLSGLMRIDRSPPPRKGIQAVFISSSVKAGAQQAAAAEPTPLPVQKTAVSEPALKPSPSKPAIKPAQKAAAAPSSSPVSKDQAGVDADTDSNSLLGRLRANWLAPPRSAPAFRCRLRIDYRPGGMIAAVVVQPPCGDRMLADSIERAVWKTQPLQLEAGAPASGSIDMEFSP